MDNITHTLYGVALSKAGMGRLSSRATLMLVVAANFPDIDWIPSLQGCTGYLNYHRGLTHSLVGVVSGALFLASLVYFINSHFLKKPPRDSWWKLFLLAVAGIGSHVLLDFTNHYGLRLFAPFENGWHSWDLVPLFDPWIFLVLLMSWAIPFLSRLINQEIGATTSRHSWVAVFGLILIVFYWGGKEYSRSEALRELKEERFATGEIQKAAVFPDIFSPFSWRGVVETTTAFHIVSMGTAWSNSPFSSKKGVVYHKLVPEPLLQALRNSPPAMVYFNFTRFPYGQFEETSDGYKLEFRDLRFEELYGPRKSRFKFICQLDRSLKVVQESFFF
jgi:inner membrane protein